MSREKFVCVFGIEEGHRFLLEGFDDNCNLCTSMVHNRSFEKHLKLNDSKLIPRSAKHVMGGCLTGVRRPTTKNTEIKLQWRMQ